MIQLPLFPQGNEVALSSVKVSLLILKCKTMSFNCNYFSYMAEVGNIFYNGSMFGEWYVRKLLNHLLI